MTRDDNWVQSWPDPIRPSAPYSVRRRRAYRIAACLFAGAIFLLAFSWAVVSFVNAMAEHR